VTSFLGGSAHCDEVLVSRWVSKMPVGPIMRKHIEILISLIRRDVIIAMSSLSDVTRCDGQKNEIIAFYISAFDIY
jgi:hypothetical protein